MQAIESKASAKLRVSGNVSSQLSPNCPRHVRHVDPEQTLRKLSHPRIIPDFLKREVPGKRWRSNTG